MTDTAASTTVSTVDRPSPVPSGAAPAVAAARARARPVRRVVRRVEPASVMKVSALFYAGVFLVALVVGVVLWVVAAAAGIVGNVENFIGDLFALEAFHFEPWQLLRGAVVTGFVLVVLGTALNALAVVLFNRVAGVVGGIELTTVDDDASTPGSVV